MVLFFRERRKKGFNFEEWGNENLDLITIGCGKSWEVSTFAKWE